MIFDTDLHLIVAIPLQASIFDFTLFYTIWFTDLMKYCHNPNNALTIKSRSKG